jgi:hypothetical protein
VKRLLGIAFAAVASVVLMAAPASAASSHRIGSCRAQGIAAICVVSGIAHHPRTIHVHATARPNQRLLIRWHMTCSKGMDVRKSRGHFRATTPIRRRLHHPFRRPDSCVVSARSRLRQGGHLHLWLTSRP